MLDSYKGRWKTLSRATRLLTPFPIRHRQWLGRVACHIAVATVAMFPMQSRADIEQCKRFAKNGGREAVQKCVHQGFVEIAQEAWIALANESDSAMRDQLRTTLLAVYRNLVDGTDDSTELLEIGRVLNELGKPASQQPIYLTRRVNLSPEMERYLDLVRQRIEDCGTRHFPEIEGKPVYGTVLLTWEIDGEGQLVGTRQIAPADNAAIWKHAQAVVRASAPFGKIPEQVRVDEMLGHRHVIVLERMNFAHDDKSQTELLPDEQACVWPAK